MIVLGIDPGTDCGWSLQENGQIKGGGVWLLDGGVSRREFEAETPDERLGRRLHLLHSKLSSLWGLMRWQRLAYELTHYKYPTQAQLHHAYVGVLSKFCWSYDVDVRRVSAATVKKRWAGHGRADKDAMADAAREKWPGREWVDHNEVDAALIAATVGGES